MIILEIIESLLEYILIFCIVAIICYVTGCTFKKEDVDGLFLLHLIIKIVWLKIHDN